MKSQPPLGTLAWAEISRGKLSRADRRNQILKVLGIRLDRMARTLIRYRPAARGKIDLNAILIPDSRSARDALELCQTTSTPSLANHCLRTYFWGALLAQTEARCYDVELFYVASLLHDLGLNERFAFRQTDCHCFAIEGALAAGAFAEQQGWSETRRRRLGDAIAQHLNVSVPPERGAEAYLLQAGASADVIGVRMETIPDDAREEILHRHPRQNFKSEIMEALMPQAVKRPESRMAFLVSVGFTKLIQAAPFGE
jgi:hypothetical protein